MPTNVELLPSVAELPTFQKTLHWLAPPMKVTELAEPVISVEAAWKMKTDDASPLRVSAPLIASASPA